MASRNGTLINPLTGYPIRQYGPTHNGLMDQGIVDSQGYVIGQVSQDEIGPRSPLHETPNPSPIIPITPEHNTRHAGERGPFCGPAAGLGPSSYPVDTPGRAHSAIGRSSNAALHGADPQAIVECAERWADANGWFHSHLNFPPDPTSQRVPQYPDGTKALDSQGRIVKR